jgi:hypothetical protein
MASFKKWCIISHLWLHWPCQSPSCLLLQQVLWWSQTGSPCLDQSVPRVYSLHRFQSLQVWPLTVNLQPMVQDDILAPLCWWHQPHCFHYNSSLSCHWLSPTRVCNDKHWSTPLLPSHHCSQEKYATEIQEHAKMTNCNPRSTAIKSTSKLTAKGGTPVADPSPYTSLERTLRYLTLTHPDIITHAMQQAWLHMHCSQEHTVVRERHFSPSSSTLSQLYQHPHSVLWCWLGGLPRYMAIHIWLLMFLLVTTSFLGLTNDNIPCLAPIRSLVVEVCCFCQLLAELRRPLQKTTVVYSDNKSADYLSTDPAQH